MHAAQKAEQPVHALCVNIVNFYRKPAGVAPMRLERRLIPGENADRRLDLRPRQFREALIGHSFQIVFRNRERRVQFLPVA